MYKKKVVKDLKMSQLNPNAVSNSNSSLSAPPTWGPFEVRVDSEVNAHHHEQEGFDYLYWILVFIILFFLVLFIFVGLGYL